MESDSEGDSHWNQTGDDDWDSDSNDDEKYPSDAPRTRSRSDELHRDEIGPKTVKSNHSHYHDPLARWSGQGSCDPTPGHGHHLYGHPVPCTSQPVRPIGGSASTNTAKWSGQAMNLIKALVPSCDTTVEIRGESQQEVKEVHVHMTQTNIHNPAAIALGGQVVVNPPSKETKSQGTPVTQTEMKKLRCETERVFEKWTEGMVKTRATNVVIDKISRGKTWITITGSPGEGKTTAGYLVLKQLHEMGRQVFEIKTPDDYFKVKEARQPVIMLNDIFGSLQFDHVKVQKWEEVITDIFRMKEHKKEEEIATRDRTKTQLTVILISRSSVLKAASRHLGRFKDLVLKEECVVDFTHIDIAAEERMKIWKCHSKGFNIDIDDKLIKEVCQMSVPHGFPHCCRLFAALCSKNKHLNIKSFFLKPLEFLNQTMESLIMDSTTGQLLRDMLIHDGMLNLNSIIDEERRFEYTKIAETLKGTYLSQDMNTVTFHHPSIYDSAAFVVCKNEPVFVVQNCSLSFLTERVRLDGLECEENSERQQTVSIDGSQLSIFLDRLRKEFEDGNLSATLSHEAFHDEGFASLFLKSVLQSKRHNSLSDKVVHFFSKAQSWANSVRHLIQQKDRNSKESFLFLMTRSKSDKILRYICQSIKLSEAEQTETLFGICANGSSSSMEYFLKIYRNFKLNVTNADLQTPLLVASTKSSGDILRLLLESNADVSITDNRGNSALHNICRHGVEPDCDVVKMLIDKGASVSMDCEELPHLPLHIACREGHRHVVRVLLECGVDVNMRDRNGDTPLLHACEMSHLDVVTVLLDREADISITGSAGNTPLHNACYWGNIDIVTVLLDSGADINMTSLVNDTPLHCACYGGHLDVLTVLLDRGADIDKAGSDGGTPLDRACFIGLVDAVTDLLDRGADINKRNRDGDTPLHTANNSRYDSVVKVLLDRGADMNMTDSAGNTTLHTACALGHVSLITLLLDRRADVNATNVVDDTPLHIACRYGLVDVITVLLDRGAEVDKRGGDGDVPLHRACYEGNVEAVIALLRGGADVKNTNSYGDTSLHKACFAGHTVIVSTLLDLGADVNRTNDDGDTPLHTARRMRRVDVVGVLSDRGADINKIDSGGHTALHRACLEGQDEVVSVLLDRGADINKPNVVGDTPLHGVCEKRTIDMVIVLLSRGADVDKRNSDGDTALHKACCMGHVEVVAVLLGRGANMSIWNNNGDTPLSLAHTWGHEDVLTVLNRYHQDGLQW